MNTLDLVILAAMGAAAVGGYRIGFLARVASWVGLALGIFVAVRLLPTVLRTFKSPDPANKLLIAAVVLIGGAFAGQALGLVLGSMMGRFIPTGPMLGADRAVGAVVGALGVLVAVWLLLPAMAEVPGAPARAARNSAVARYLDANLPGPPDALQTLRRLVGANGFPRVFDALRPSPVTGPPPSSTGLSAVTLGRVGAATVKVSGQACNRIQEGSGCAVAADTVVTNAHVVAGERFTEVLRPDGRRMRAFVTLFDPDRDLAILSVSGLGEPSLGIGAGREGTNGAVFGHPGGQDQLRVAPAAVRRRVTAIGRDLYDSHTTKREVFILASDLHPGDSGGALVDTGGTVVGVAFAIAPDRPGTSYALTSRELTTDLAVRRGGSVSTGPCLSNA